MNQARRTQFFQFSIVERRKVARANTRPPIASRKRLDGSGTVTGAEIAGKRNDVGDPATGSPIDELPRSVPPGIGPSITGVLESATLASGLPEASLASIVTSPGFFDVPPITSAPWMM